MKDVIVNWFVCMFLMHDNLHGCFSIDNENDLSDGRPKRQPLERAFDGLECHLISGTRIFRVQSLFIMR
ncbi:hypothetical protein [Hwanghaeella grinnelliae]|uniref:hypothetical protein n=1 Tax=Hwanghaeella grinnelliae TaxID=2500179 RepID=UPI0013869B50|nr:hypothetical protein [Hwanghaeella grinnelliae]